MNKKTIEYQHYLGAIYLDPNSEAYKMYKESRLGDLDKHLETIMRKGK